MSFGSSGGMMAARAGEQPAINALSQGTSNLNTAGNFFSTVLGGNQANTRAVLQPDINRINESLQGALQGASTMMPRGGGRFATLFQQPFAAQQQVNNLFNGIRGQAAGGLAGIGSQQAQIGQTAATNLFSQDMAQKQMLNDFIQKMYASTVDAASKAASGGCWIAEAIYGTDDPRTHLVRAWLNGPFKKTKVGRVAMRLYLAFGQRIAVLVRKHNLLKLIFKPLFDTALRRAIQCR